jgi:hypothetical protein
LVATSDGGYAIAGHTGSYGAGPCDGWLIKTDSSGNMLWNQTYGGIMIESFQSLVETSDGGYAVAGCKESLVGGFMDFWLMKTDAMGNEEWNQTYGGTRGERARSLVATSDGGYALAGYTNSLGGQGCWLVKTDESGNLEWDRLYGNAGAEAHSLVVTHDGGYALAGNTWHYGAEIWYFLLVKTDSSGTSPEFPPS